MKFHSPRAGILLYLLLVISVFASDAIEVSLILLLIVLVLAVRVSFSALKRGFLPISIFLLFTFISNILFQEGNVLYEIFGFDITDEGLRLGGRLTLRLLVLIAGAKVLTASIKSEELINGMRGLLGPLGRVGFVQELLYIMLLTLRILPVIYDEAVELYRNMRISTGSSMKDKIKLSVELLTMLFERSLLKAREMVDLNETCMPENGKKGN